MNWTEFVPPLVFMVTGAAIYSAGYWRGVRSEREFVDRFNARPRTVVEFRELTREQAEMIRGEVQRAIDNREIRLEGGLEPGNR